jgi:hypothetical protein
MEPGRGDAAAGCGGGEAEGINVRIDAEEPRLGASQSHWLLVWLACHASPKVGQGREGTSTAFAGLTAFVGCPPCQHLRGSSEAAVSSPQIRNSETTGFRFGVLGAAEPNGRNYSRLLDRCE